VIYVASIASTTHVIGVEVTVRVHVMAVQQETGSIVEANNVNSVEAERISGKAGKLLCVVFHMAGSSGTVGCGWCK
jgi:hypothetical protein